MESSDPDRPEYEPWQRIGTETYRRRYELFALAAPVFERHGYRGATIRALAYACHLSPAGLYHYFGSKRELATYLLHAPQLRWDTVHVATGLHPLEQLSALIGMAIRNVPLYLLALRMQEEIDGRPLDPAIRARSFREGEVVFGRLISEAGRALTRDEAITLSRDCLAILIGSAYAVLDPEPGEAVRRRIVDRLRQALVPGSVDAERFDRAMAPPENRTEQRTDSVSAAIG